MKVKGIRLTESLRRIWLFSANTIKKCSESVNKQPYQLIVKLNSSLGHIIVTVVCRQMCTIQCIGYKQTGLGKIDFLINFLNYINIRCFHQIVSLIFSKNFSQFEQLKKKS